MATFAQDYEPLPGLVWELGKTCMPEQGADLLHHDDGDVMGKPS